VRDGDDTGLIQKQCQQDFLDIAKIITKNWDSVDWLREFNPQNKQVKLWMCAGFFEKYAKVKNLEMDMALQVFFNDKVLHFQDINSLKLEPLRQILLDHPAEQTLYESQIELVAVRRLLGKDDQWDVVFDTVDSNIKDDDWDFDQDDEIEMKLYYKVVKEREAKNEINAKNTIKIEQVMKNLKGLPEKELLNKEKQLEGVVKDGKIRVSKIKQFEKKF